ncbi:UDP-N-acetylmuramoyl-tripeptide--D-alanyl-D-alanine ligase [Aquimarina algicola]|uniref:UDP-N-acetylmuramoyl-tripeptide--D-alanyl-D-alanine ligase n=1 Tax=Aquimarina algicola TaxID=2589995 RepID=A0A504J2T5_9FLAO|nr:UDP-N-acetylmuramoyl-tripeptide--D-alanyl-D-alanine ligase [Aquimarina algicola]TPN81399.1 UDP-N-acetylmuramoyl-tripeptide--D-alanyl-D-alanine ligase [Aquimarina algicola]
MTIHQIHQLFLKSNGISTDTRKIEQNAIFFALKGENFDGNTYADRALELGAKYAVIDDKKHKTTDNHILVSNSLDTLQKLATYHRQYLDIPIIALTGSNGKTTTKELINCVLSSKFNTTATIGNLNNHIGVPLTLLSMSKDTQVGIVEMGANHQGEIELLCNITMPDYGFITNIGKAHLEGFGGLKGVLKGKTELYRHLKKNNKIVFLNLEDKKLVEASKDISTYTFSEFNTGNVCVKFIEANPNVTISFNDITIESNLIGAYNFSNIAAAITIGSYFDINKENIKKAIEGYTPKNNRSQIIQTAKHTIILDAYNANPSSMEAAIKNFEQLNASHKIVFLGDMFELGEEASVEHQKIASLINNTNTDNIYLIGSNFYKTSTTDIRIKKFESYDDFKSQFYLNSEKSTILIKGSRGMKLERILDLF